MVFEVDANLRQTGVIRVIHKGRCETEVTRPLPWDDVDVFLLYLTRNVEIDLDATSERLRCGPGGV